MYTLLSSGCCEGIVFSLFFSRAQGAQYLVCVCTALAASISPLQFRHFPSFIFRPSNPEGPRVIRRFSKRGSPTRVRTPADGRRKVSRRTSPLETRSSSGDCLALSERD